jgi:enoyl-CoA hydratase/carnithine racemase
VSSPAPGRPPGQPDAGQPDAGQPDAGQPDAGQPDAGQPAVIVARSGPLALLTLNRPHAANAFDAEMLGDLHRIIGEIGADRSVRAVILTGAGRHFSGGADLREERARQRAARERFGRGVDMSRLPQPVIAAINGAALGGGCELALTCDFRFMSADAQIGLTEIRFGALPVGGGTARLPRVVGLQWAKRMIMTGDPVDAQLAESIGLVDEVVPAAELMASAEQFAMRLTSRADYAIRAAKALLDAALETDLQTALARERAVVSSMATRGERAAERRRAAAQQPTYRRIFSQKE